MLICAEQFTGTLQGSQPSTEISFILPLNCEKQFSWFKESHMDYFFCLHAFLETSEMVRWFWCVSSLSLHSSCVAHLHHSIWLTSHPLPWPVSRSFTLLLCTAVSLLGGISVSQRRETRATPENGALIYKAVATAEGNLPCSYLLPGKNRKMAHWNRNMEWPKLTVPVVKWWPFKSQGNRTFILKGGSIITEFR